MRRHRPRAGRNADRVPSSSRRRYPRTVNVVGARGEDPEKNPTGPEGASGGRGPRLARGARSEPGPGERARLATCCSRLLHDRRELGRRSGRDAQDGAGRLHHGLGSGTRCPAAAKVRHRRRAVARKLERALHGGSMAPAREAPVKTGCRRGEVSPAERPASAAVRGAPRASGTGGTPSRSDRSGRVDRWRCGTTCSADPRTASPPTGGTRAVRRGWARHRTCVRSLVRRPRK